MLKITFNEHLPLDGAGTLISPAHKWLVKERTEYCDNISKVGNIWYMWRGGFVYKSVEPEKITRLDGLHGTIASITHYIGSPYPFSCRYTNKFGKEFGAGYAEFSELVRDFYFYKKCGI